MKTQYIKYAVVAAIMIFKFQEWLWALFIIWAVMYYLFDNDKPKHKDKNESP